MVFTPIPCFCMFKSGVWQCASLLYQACCLLIRKWIWRFIREHGVPHVHLFHPCNHHTTDSVMVSYCWWLNPDLECRKHMKAQSFVKPDNCIWQIDCEYYSQLHPPASSVAVGHSQRQFFTPPFPYLDGNFRNAVSAVVFSTTRFNLICVSNLCRSTEKFMIYCPFINHDFLGSRLILPNPQLMYTLDWHILLSIIWSFNWDNQCCFGMWWTLQLM